MSETPRSEILGPGDEPEGFGEGSRAPASNPKQIETWQPETRPFAPTLAVFEDPFPATEIVEPHSQAQSGEPPLFEYWLRPDTYPPARIPHLGHVCLLIVFATFGLLGAVLLTRSALHFHLFGVSTVTEAANDIQYALGNMAAIYLITFLACLVFFPLVWHKGFFAGLQWHGATALRLRYRLLGAAFTCFVLAMIDEVLLPGPANAPIDKLFQTPREAWLLFAFGVTFAPFFEEMAYRGFLLPALATAWDWAIEQSTGRPPRPLDEDGHPQWSMFAMVGASIASSIPFALMHAEQTAHALGPFLLLVCVSLVLCWTRLATRSLAASVAVHSCYNFLLFSLMLLGTSGFKHMEKL
jgi:hypothetical protein